MDKPQNSCGPMEEAGEKPKEKKRKSYFMIPFIWTTQKGKYIETGSRLVAV